jgi:RNA polymerase sigma-70 factor, ECF subfamily
METDSLLLNAARMMDEEALAQIFDLYSPALYSYAMRICGNPVLADHIVGDVFVNLLEQFAAGNGPTTNLRSYLYESAYHQIIDEARYSQRQVPIEVAISLQQDAHLSLEAQVLLRQILHAIRNELTDDQRHVIILRFLEGFSIRETAKIIGKKVDHVKVIQNRALKKLRESIEVKGRKKPIPSLRLRKLSKAFGI